MKNKYGNNENTGGIFIKSKLEKKLLIDNVSMIEKTAQVFRSLYSQERKNAAFEVLCSCTCIDEKRKIQICRKFFPEYDW